MKVEQIYTGCLAEAAYYIESEGEAVIIDPLRETRPYLEKLEHQNAKLKYIFETHFHADFVSGHLDLSEKTGATIVYGPGANAKFNYHEGIDGEFLTLGKIRFQILHTPGHTPESTTYLLFDEDGNEYAIFTGDTLFIGDVGRPDLAQETTDLDQEALAGKLYDSLRNKIMPLPDEVLVYPGHGAGSACGKNMSSKTWDSLASQKQINYALRADMTREEFIREVTEGLTLPPGYFQENARMNKMGYGSIDDILERGQNPLTPEKFERLANTMDAMILDVRNKEDFARAHIPNSIYIGLDGSFAPWVGALITDIRQNIILVTPKGKEEEAVTRLSRVGYDNTLGFLAGGIEAWQADGRETDSVTSVSADAMSSLYKEGINVVDVRKESEFKSTHVDGAMNMPLTYINAQMSKIDRNKPFYFYCRTGYRSMIALSILKARGFEKIVDITGGLMAIEETDIPQSDFVCPTQKLSAN